MAQIVYELLRRDSLHGVFEIRRAGSYHTAHLQSSINITHADLCHKGQCQQLLYSISSEVRNEG
jgi:hypothetical protein